MKLPLHVAQIRRDACAKNNCVHPDLNFDDPYAWCPDKHFGPYLRRGEVVQNAFGAFGRVAKAVVTRKTITVSPEEKERRLAICHACEWFQANTCMKCGCVASWKTKLATEHCPDIPPRW